MMIHIRTKLIEKGESACVGSLHITIDVEFSETEINRMPSFGNFSVIFL